MPKRTRHGSEYVEMVRARENAIADATRTVNAVQSHRAYADLSHNVPEPTRTHTYTPTPVPDTFRGNIHSARRTDGMNPNVNRAPHEIEKRIPDSPLTSGQYMPTASTQYYTADASVKSPKSKPDKWLMIIGNTYIADDGTPVRLTRYNADTREYGYVVLGDTVLHLITGRAFRKAFHPERVVTARTYART